jgi:UDP-glucose 4-epimerase
MIGTKVVVTGGAGFIGSHLARKLVELGHEVHVIDDLSFGSRERVPSASELHVVDIRDTAALKPVLQGADTVFHLAAVSSVQLSLEDPVRVHAVNVHGTVCILDAARRAKVRRVVYSSSSAVYGDRASVPLREDMEAAPQSPYGLSKYEGELAAKLFSTAFGLETVCLRYFNVYGPGQDPNGPYAAVIARFMEASKAGRPLQIIGDGAQTRDFIMVDDVVVANLAAATSTRVGKGEAINIGTGASTSIVELAHLVGENFEFVPNRQEIRHSRADLSRAHDLLDFCPTISLASGLRRISLQDVLLGSAMQSAQPSFHRDATAQDEQ